MSESYFMSAGVTKITTMSNSLPIIVMNVHTA